MTGNMVTEYRDEILKVTKGGLVTTQMEFEKGDTRVVSKPAATTTIASSRSPKYSTDDERSVGSSDVSGDASMKNEPLKNTNTVKEEGRKGAILDMLEDESENKSLAPEGTPEPVESPRAPLSAIVDERNTRRNPFDIGHDEFLIGLGAVAALSVGLITSIEEEGADESGESDNNDKEVSAKKKKVRKARDEETRRKQAGEEKALKAKAAAEAESKRIAQAERLEKEKKAMVIKKAKEQEKVKEAAAEAERKRIFEAKRLEKERMEIALKKAEEETAQKANVEAEQEELAMKNATEQAKTLEAKRIAEAKRLEQEKKEIAKKKKAEQAKARKLKTAAEAEAKRIDDAKRLEQEKEKIAANQAEEEKVRKAKAVAKAEAEAEAEAKRISEAERLKQEKEKIAAKQAEEEKARKAKAAAEAEAEAKRIVEAERLDQEKKVIAKKKKAEQAKALEAKRIADAERLEQEKGKARKVKAAREAEAKRIAEAERLEQGKKETVSKKVADQEKARKAKAAAEAEAEGMGIAEAKGQDKEMVSKKAADQEKARQARAAAYAKRIAEAERLDQEKKGMARKSSEEEEKAAQAKAPAEAEAEGMGIAEAKGQDKKEDMVSKKVADQEKATQAKAAAEAEAEGMGIAEAKGQDKEMVSKKAADQEKARQARAAAYAKRIAEAERLDQEKKGMARKSSEEEEKVPKAKAPAEAEAEGMGIAEAKGQDKKEDMVSKKVADQENALQARAAAYAKRIAEAERLEQEKKDMKNLEEEEKAAQAKAPAEAEAEAKQVAEPEAEWLEQEKEDMVSKKAADEEKARMAQAAVENNNNETPVDLDSKTEAISQATPFDKTRADFQVLELDRHSTYETTHEIRASASSTATNKETPEDLSFTYDFDELVVGNDSTSAPTTAVMLIHPIGVGIGRWYYDRLMLALDEKYGGGDRRYVFISPDLLGSGSACSPIIESGEEIEKLPLLTIRDWSEQLEELMADYEAKSTSEGHVVENWCVVANGGCSPIALKVAEHAAELTVPFEGKVTNVVLSSPPRLPFFLEGTDPAEVQKSYRTLCGPAGKLFWWYSLRKGGRFVQKFSERNLVGNPESLGEAWTPNCVATGKLDGGRSRYSTFAFLAGTLQEGCQASLDVLRGKDVKIDFIRGKDKRKNKARSWFWKRSKNGKGEDELKKDNGDSVDTVGQLVAATEALSPTGEEEETIQDYVKRNGNSGKTKWVGGRISLAHEDGEGYATALMEHIS